MQKSGRPSVVKQSKPCYLRGLNAHEPSQRLQQEFQIALTPGAFANFSARGNQFFRGLLLTVRALSANSKAIRWPSSSKTEARRQTSRYSMIAADDRPSTVGLVVMRVFMRVHLLVAPLRAVPEPGFLSDRPSPVLAFPCSCSNSFSNGAGEVRH